MVKSETVEMEVYEVDKETREKRSRRYHVPCAYAQDSGNAMNNCTLQIEITEENEAISLYLTHEENKTETFTALNKPTNFSYSSNHLAIETDVGKLNLVFKTEKDAEDVISIIKTARPDDQKDQEDLKKAFSKDLQEGKFYEHFKQYIRTCAEDAKLFAPVGTIIQSSGHGKSKTMEWFSRENFVVFLCLREKQAIGFPPRSKLADSFLSAMENVENAELFIAGLIHTALDVITNIKKENGAKDIKKTSEIASEFYIYQPWCTNLSDKIKSGTFNKGVLAFCSENVKKIEDSDYMESIHKDLVKRYEDTLGKEHLYIFLDEATSLLQVSQLNDNTDNVNFISKYRVMRRAAKNIHHELPTIAFMLAATNSNLHEFVPNPRNLSGSERSAASEYEIKQPFFKILYTDIHAEEDIKEFEKDTTKLHQFITSRVPNKSLFLYGRPLWKSIKNAKELAIAKLICAENWSAVRKEDKIFATLAVLSVRTTLSLNYNNVYGKEMVARYMSTLFYIEPKLNYYSTCYFSEPVLAEASAHIMSEEETLIEILNYFNSYMQTCSLNTVGALGEIVAEVILLLAFDNAIKTKKKPLHSMPITVKEFVESLVGGKAEMILKTLKKEFRDGFVYFTHFIKKLDDLDYDSVRSHFLVRCAAVQLKDSQKNIDLVIPVVLSNNEIGFIVVQVKNYAKTTEKFLIDVAKTTRPYPDLYKGSKDDDKKKYLAENDYLGLVMSIGAESDENENQIEAVDIPSVNTRRTSEIRRKNFILRGLKVYPFLNGRVGSTLENLTHCGRTNVTSMFKIYDKEVLKNVCRQSFKNSVFTDNP